MVALRRVLTTVVFGVTIGLAQSVPAQPIVIDGNGTGLGTLIEAFPNGGPKSPRQVPFSGFAVTSPTTSYWIINENSYQFILRWPMFNFDTSESLQNATLGSFGDGILYYESQDCTAQPFFATRHSGIISSIDNLSGAAGADEGQSIYYVPLSEELQKRTFFSQLTSVTADCESLSGTTYNFSGSAYPNDPAETGFTDPTPPMPIRLRSAIDPALARCVFRDGFECEA